MKKQLSEKDKKTLIILIIAVLGFLLYQYGYVYFTDKRNALKIEYETLDAQNQKNQEKITKIPTLNKEIASTEASIIGYSEKYYGQIPQENILYFIQEIGEKSNLKLFSIKFENKPDEVLSSMLAVSEPQAPAIVEETTEDINKDASTPPVVEETPVQVEPMRTDVINAIVEFTGTYDQLRTFFNLVDNNKEKVVINNIILERAKGSYLNFPGYEIEGGYEHYENKLFDQNEAYTEKVTAFDDTENKSPDEIEATIGFSFYLIPTINQYKEQQNINKWELKSSTNNLFTWIDFLNTPLQKTHLYDFDQETYTVTSKGAENAGQFEKTQEDKVYAGLRYTFNESSKNPMISLDLSDKGIEIKEAVKEIGINVYSDNVNKSKLYIVVQDANNKEHAILLTESIYWKGFANIDKEIDASIAYPLKVKRIVLSQEGEGTALKNGLLKLGFLYVKK